MGGGRPPAGRNSFAGPNCDAALTSQIPSQGRWFAGVPRQFTLDVPTATGIFYTSPSCYRLPGHLLAPIKRRSGDWREAEQQLPLRVPKEKRPGILTETAAPAAGVSRRFKKPGKGRRTASSAKTSGTGGSIYGRGTAQFTFAYTYYYRAGPRALAVDSWF